MKGRRFPAIVFITAVIIVCSLFSGCGNTSLKRSLPQNRVSRGIGQLFKAYNRPGQIGKVYYTHWFAFRVDSAERVGEYKGYKAAGGNQLLDIVITERNTF